MNSEFSFTKKQHLLEKLDQGMTQVHINTACSGVDLPPHLMRDTSCILNLSYLFHLDIFEIEEDEVRASLSFAGQSYLCKIPWASIYMIALSKQPEDHHIYLEDMPVHVLQELLSSLEHMVPKKTNHLTSVDPLDVNQDLHVDPPPFRIMTAAQELEEFGYLREQVPLDESEE